MHDHINGLYEVFGAAILWLNVVKLRRDKCVRGVDWRTTAFFSSWGCWNLYFYPAVGCWLSFIGAIALLVSNVAWLSLVAFYSVQKHRLEQLDLINVTSKSPQNPA